MSNLPATRPAKSWPKGISTYSGVTPRSAIIASVSSIWYPVGFPDESLNWIGGNVRSTPSFAFLLDTHLSRTEFSAAFAVVPCVLEDCSHAARAHAPAPRAAAPPGLRSQRRLGRRTGERRVGKEGRSRW